MPRMCRISRFICLPMLLPLLFCAGCSLLQSEENWEPSSLQPTLLRGERRPGSQSSAPDEPRPAVQTSTLPDAAVGIGLTVPASAQDLPTDQPDIFTKEVLNGSPAKECCPGAAVNPWVWGIVELQGYPLADHIAPNGVEYKPVFSTDMQFNLWLWRRQRLYVFTDLAFWAQKAAPGITNPTQGPFDFSKREFDLTAGLAWNYWDRWEARVFAYSFNNLNRGDSATAPAGFNDGVGIENRYYIGNTYDALGTADFDLARATFIGAGFYPTKDMVDSQGNTFKPGLFAHAYLTLDLWGEQCYLYGDTTIVARDTVIPKLLYLDFGVALRPFISAKRWEFRIGSKEIFDLQFRDTETSIYGAVRFIF